MSWLDNTPDREIDPPEYDHARCEMCGDTIPVTSRSPYYCDDCLDERIAERSRREMREALTGITRSLDKIGSSTFGKNQA